MVYDTILKQLNILYLKYTIPTIQNEKLIYEWTDNNVKELWYFLQEQLSSALSE